MGDAGSRKILEAHRKKLPETRFHDVSLWYNFRIKTC